MTRMGLRQLQRWLVVLTTTAVWGCADQLPAGPSLPGALGAPDSAAFARSPDLGGCDSLRVAESNQLTLHAFASGVQIYKWNGTSWTFIAPQATLFAGAGNNGVLGTHYAGPTWESTSGSKVVAAVAKRCPADASSIPWLLLQGVSSTGPGIFEGVTFVQRLNTVGGNAPANPGTSMGETANVPYTAEYYFYRAK